MIDPGMKWSEYKGDTLYLWNGDTLYTATEEDESTTLEEDCWLVDIYSLYEPVPQGGCWIEDVPIKDSDYTIKGIMERLKGCDLWEDNWTVLDPEIGETLRSGFEIVIHHKIMWKMAKENLEDFLAEKDLVGKEGANGSEF